MRIIVFKIPCTMGPNGFIMHEDKKELQPEKEEKVNDGDKMKVLAEVNRYNQEQQSVSEMIPGDSIIFRKILVE